MIVLLAYQPEKHSFTHEIQKKQDQPALRKGTAKVCGKKSQKMLHYAGITGVRIITTFISSFWPALLQVF